MAHDLEVLTGRRLRYAVAVLLREAERTMSLADLAADLAAWGYGTSAEPRKAISDALRWELHRGRHPSILHRSWRPPSLGVAPRQIICNFCLALPAVAVGAARSQ